MQEVDLYSLVDCATNTSIKSRHEIMKIYESSFEVKTKQDNFLITIADKNSNTIIEKALKVSEIHFLIEEGKASVYPKYALTINWDIAAIHAIANMVGFKIIEYNSTKEIIYNKEKLLNPWFLVS